MLKRITDKYGGPILGVIACIFMLWGMGVGFRQLDEQVTRTKRETGIVLIEHPEYTIDEARSEAYRRRVVQEEKAYRQELIDLAHKKGEK